MTSKYEERHSKVGASQVYLPVGDRNRVTLRQMYARVSPRFEEGKESGKGSIAEGGRRRLKEFVSRLVPLLRFLAFQEGR